MAWQYVREITDRRIVYIKTDSKFLNVFTPSLNKKSLGKTALHFEKTENRHAASFKK